MNMRKYTLFPILALASLSVSPLSRAADDNCLKVVAYEWAGESATADPGVLTEMSDVHRTKPAYETLFRVDNSFQIQPLLAESSESNPDGSEWLIHLRKGVKFHDGSDFDASDVVWTYRRLLDPSTKSGATAILSVFLEPENITAVDTHTVKFVPNGPTVELPMQIITKEAGIIPEGYTHEMLMETSAGTGPYVLVDFKPGNTQEKHVANKSYWNPDEPKADCLVTVPIIDATARAAALMAGQVDLVPVVDPATVQTLRKNPAVSLNVAPSGTVMTISMWVDEPPFDDVRVRKAMKLVVDRQKMVDTALFGVGVPGNDNPIAPTLADAYRTDVIPQDCEKAKELLAEAGYPEGLDLELNTGEAFPGMVNVAQAYAQMASCGNLRVTVIKNPAEGYWDNIWLKRPLITSSWGGRPASEAFAIAYTSNAKWPETHYGNAEFDALLVQASQTVDNAARTKLYQQAQEILAEDGGVIVPGFLTTVAAMRDGCSGYVAEVNVNNFYIGPFGCDDK